jgi:hypothetical protein
MGFANQQGETALQEENDQEGLNGVNCRNSLRVNCSTIELGTRGIWVAFGLITGAGLILSGRAAVRFWTNQVANINFTRWRMASRNHR